MSIEIPHQKGSTYLYDAGGWFLITVFFGIYVVGVVLDYLWNYLVLSLTLWRFKTSSGNSAVSLAKYLGIRKRHIYCAIATALGLLIDWLYYELVWGTLVLGGMRVSAIFPRPGTAPGLEIATILAPVVALFAANFAMSRLYLHLNPKQAGVVGVAMGIFTAPWLIVAFQLLGTRPL